MRKLLLVTVLLFGAFLSVWTYKFKNPSKRPDEYANGYDSNAGAWWNTSSGSVEVKDGWSLKGLDVPDNYIPVPGESNLFMVTDSDGKITGYMKRTLQMDGSWKWEQVNPDIPDNYVPVKGHKNLFKVTDKNGKVHYMLYIRNDDDTFAFVECDKNGNPIGREKDATTIDLKHHVNITGNIYKLLDDNGVVIGYQQRVDKGKGKFEWEDIPNFEDIVKDLESTGDSDGKDSDIDLQKIYDELKKNQDSSTASTGLSMPDIPTASVSGAGGGSGTTINVTQGSQGNTVSATPGQTTVINGADGTVTKKKVVRETKTDENGRKTVQESVVIQKFDADGNLIQSSTQGPYTVSSQTEVSLTHNDTPAADPNAVVSSLGGEVARYTANVTFDENTASQVITGLNAKRAEKGLSSLQITDTAISLAKLRCADMAMYDVTKADLPTYGPLTSMLTKFGIGTDVTPGENMWKTTQKSAADINTRLFSDKKTAGTRLGKKITQVGVAIINSGSGSTYYIEVFL